MGACCMGGVMHGGSVAQGCVAWDCCMGDVALWGVAHEGCVVRGGGAVGTFQVHFVSVCVYI